MRFYCSKCGYTFEQDENPTGPNVCLRCGHLLYPPLFLVPGWIVGVVVILYTTVFLQW